MLAPPLQPCPACLQKSVRLCEGAGQIPTPELQKQLLGANEKRLLGGGQLPMERSNDWDWHLDRLLLYLCAACSYARLSISGLLKEDHELNQNTAVRHRERSYRVLVLQHDIHPRDETTRSGALSDDGIGDSRSVSSQAGGAFRNPRFLVPGRRLIQQSASPVVFVSGDHCEEETYPPAEWTYFFEGEEVCREVFREELSRAYDRCRATRLTGTRQ